MKTKVYYDEIAKGYNELYGEEQLKKWEIAKKLINLSKNDRVLDLGCGTGLITEKISKKVDSIVGLDLSEEMIKNSIKRNNISYVVGNAKKLPFENNEFDKVVSFTVIQDIDKWDYVLKEIKRVSKGEILITVLKRKKNLTELKKIISAYFKIKNFDEEEKDFIFLLE